MTKQKKECVFNAEIPLSTNKNTVERTFVPIPDMFTKMFTLENTNNSLPNVYLNHASVCFGSKRDSKVVLMSTQRIREKNVVVMYYKPMPKSLN